MAVKRDVCCLVAIVVTTGFIAGCSGLKPAENPVVTTIATRQQTSRFTAME